MAEGRKHDERALPACTCLATASVSSVCHAQVMPRHGRRPVEAVAAASSSGDPASRVVARRGRVCETPGCGKEYARTRHRNCCSMCTVGAHTADFAKFSRRLSRAMRREQRGALTTCSTPTCMRVAGLGHHTCCGPCGHRRRGAYNTLLQSSELPDDAACTRRDDNNLRGNCWQ